MTSRQQPRQQTMTSTTSTMSTTRLPRKRYYISKRVPCFLCSKPLQRVPGTSRRVFVVLRINGHDVRCHVGCADDLLRYEDDRAGYSSVKMVLEGGETSAVYCPPF